MELNTTIDNIQLKSNMLTTAEDADEVADNWNTDEKYPSAAAVANLVNTTTNAIIEACENTSGKVEYPIGSVLITSTNANPSTSVGGTWELIDKEYKNAMVPLPANASIWTPGSATLTAGYVTKAGHSIRLRLVLTATNSLSSGATTDALKLGTISPTAIGASSEIPFLAFNIVDLMVGIVQAVNKEGTKTYDIQYHINTSGVITITKIFNNETLPVDTVIDLTAYIPMEQFFMADTACDKFYWKRTK